jgi:hypothetical protein
MIKKIIKLLLFSDDEINQKYFNLLKYQINKKDQEIKELKITIKIQKNTISYIESKSSWSLIDKLIFLRDGLYKINEIKKLKKQKIKEASIIENKKIINFNDIQRKM